MAVELEKVAPGKYRNQELRLTIKQGHCGVWFIKVNSEHQYASRSWDKCMAWLKKHLTPEP